MKAALNCFLSDDYKQVTTRQIAEEAGVNASMIRYYFKNKEGLYEDMIRQTLSPLIEAVGNINAETDNPISEFFRIYYNTMTTNPSFPALLLKIMASENGPGKALLESLFEQGRSRGLSAFKELETSNKDGMNVPFDLLRVSFVSLAMMPILARESFEKSSNIKMNEDFFNELANFNGALLMRALNN